MVADNQFSTLGVVLIAVLARVGRIIGLPAIESNVVAASAGGKILLASSFRETGEVRGETVLREYGEDMGKVVERRTIVEELKVINTFKEESSKKSSKRLLANQPKSSEMVNVDRASTRPEKPTKGETEARPKKRRKKGNAIDDLFGNLV